MRPSIGRFLGLLIFLLSSSSVVAQINSDNLELTLELNPSYVVGEHVYAKLIVTNISQDTVMVPTQSDPCIISKQAKKAYDHDARIWNPEYVPMEITVGTDPDGRPQIKDSVSAPSFL